MNRYAQLGRIGALALLVPSALGAAREGNAAEGGETMLYLVEFKATLSGDPTSVEQAIELLRDKIVPSLEKLAGEGRIKGGGLFVGARAGVFIVGAKSHDEVTELVHDLPAWGVWDWSVKPLESFARRAELETKTVRQLRAQLR